MSRVQKSIALLSIGFALGCAGVASADEVTAPFESTVASLAERSDYTSLNSLSKLYFVLATAQRDVNDLRGACATLSQSLAYYRQALANEPHTPSYERAVAMDGPEDAAMREVRMRFGCPDAGAAQAAAASFGTLIPVLSARDDYWTLGLMSKLYLALASAQRGADDMRAACATLSVSMDYNRRALAKEPHTPSYERPVAFDDPEDAGVRQARAEFGCSQPGGGLRLQHARRP
jgi:hypothetical protein